MFVERLHTGSVYYRWTPVSRVSIWREKGDRKRERGDREDETRRRGKDGETERRRGRYLSAGEMVTFGKAASEKV